MAAPVCAQPATITAKTAVAPRTMLQLRVGPTSSALRPQVCAELAPLQWLAVEACGTGAGLWHADGGEIAHFRGSAQLATTPLSGGWLAARATAGFAELQVSGEDEAGFDFLGTGASGGSTAGAEGGLGVRWTRELSGDFELVLDALGSLAWLPFAPKLKSPRSVWQPVVGLSVGVGW